MHKGSAWLRTYPRLQAAYAAGTTLRSGNGQLIETLNDVRFPVVGTGVDPVTSRFSGARSTN